MPLMMNGLSDYILHLQHSKPGAKKPINKITNYNESSAGHIAQGIVKISVTLKTAGVVVVTSSPGVTNLITPLQDAMCDGVPIMALCCQATMTAPPDAFQQAPTVELKKPCTKWSFQQ